MLDRYTVFLLSLPRGLAIGGLLTLAASSLAAILLLCWFATDPIHGLWQLFIPIVHGLALFGLRKLGCSWATTLFFMEMALLILFGLFVPWKTVLARGASMLIFLACMGMMLTIGGAPDKPLAASNDGEQRT
ncbi:hypothetical protein IT575_02625 [bacterium]|nr:hypothetical protein [bacterium]